MRALLIEIAVATMCLGTSSCAQHDMFRPTAVSSGVAGGNILYKELPRYMCHSPYSSTQSAEVVIDKEGDVVEAHSLFGAEVGRANFLEAVRRWKYRPFEAGGRPIAVRTTITMTASCGG